MARYSHLRPEMGLSARAIAGEGGRFGRADYPHDPSDLVRCVAYCDRNGIDTAELAQRMARRSIEWARLVVAWDHLVALLRHEVETTTNGLAPRTYNEMKRVLADGVSCATCDGTGRGEECAKCKGTGRRCGGRCRAERCFRGADYCPSCRGNGYTTTAKAS